MFFHPLSWTFSFAASRDCGLLRTGDYTFFLFRGKKRFILALLSFFDADFNDVLRTKKKGKLFFLMILFVSLSFRVILRLRVLNTAYNFSVPQITSLILKMRCTIESPQYSREIFITFFYYIIFPSVKCFFRLLKKDFFPPSVSCFKALGIKILKKPRTIYIKWTRMH